MRQLEVLQQMSAELGMIREIEVDTTDSECVVHLTPLMENRVETIGGWQSVLVCPAFDGTCRYDPDGTPIPIEPPASAEREPVSAGQERDGAF